MFSNTERKNRGGKNGQPIFRAMAPCIAQSIQTTPQSPIVGFQRPSLAFVPSVAGHSVSIVRKSPTPSEVDNISLSSGYSAKMRETTSPHTSPVITPYNSVPPNTNVSAVASGSMNGRIIHQSPMPSPQSSSVIVAPRSPERSPMSLPYSEVKQSCDSPMYQPSPVAMAVQTPSYVLNSLVPSGRAVLADNYVSGHYFMTPQDSKFEKEVSVWLHRMFTDEILTQEQHLCERFIKQPSTKDTKCYYIHLEFVVSHPKFRNVSPNVRRLLKNLILKSKSLHLTENNYVGKKSFIPLPMRDFPSHHSVFIGGIPAHTLKKSLAEILRVFGKVKKITFDAGVHSVDRQVMLKLAQRQGYVHFLNYMSSNGPKPLQFGVERNAPHYMQFQCVGMKCQGREYKKVRNGYFCDDLKNPNIQMCLSCAGERAKAMIDEYQQLIPNFRDNPCLATYFTQTRFGKGLLDYMGNERYSASHKSAIVVFDSHKQASHCLFVIRRLSICGLFGTHYHHYQITKQAVLEASLRQQLFN